MGVEGITGEMDLVDVKRVAVNFGTAQEVLNAYWGYLSDGGLVIQDATELTLGEGDPVAVNIRIASLEQEYSLRGRVVRRAPTGERTVIAFNPGEPHDMLLTAVLAETDDVPARRRRRYPVDLAAAVASEAAPVSVRVVNVSEDGCCVRLPADHGGALPAGTNNVVVEADGFTARGRVVWSHRAERGVLFDGDHDGALRSLIDKL